jgi:hypothetical protein
MSSYTYDISDTVGKIRLIIGDTDVDPSADAVFSDEELTYFYTTKGTINLAAAMALRAWAAKYSASPDSEKIGDYSYNQKITDKMLALAKELEQAEAETPYLTWAEFDLSGVEE